MIWLKRSVLALFALLVLALVVIYLTPLDTYVPKVERTLTEQLQAPVHIQHLHIAVWPLPYLEIRGVRVGEQDAMTAESVDVKIDLTDLLVDKELALRVEVRNGSAELSQIHSFAERFAKISAVRQNVRLKELQFFGMRLVTPELSLEQLQAKLEFSKAGVLQRAWLALDEQKFTAILIPQGDKQFSVQVRARDWTPPQQPALHLQELQLDGVLTQQELVLHNFVIAMGGMRAAGLGKLNFSDGWQLQATLKQLEIPLEQLSRGMNQSFELAGVIRLRGSLNAKSDSWNTLKDHFQFSGNMDVGRVTASAIGDNKRQFLIDEVKAQLMVQPEHIEISKLQAKLYGGKVSGVASIERHNQMLNADLIVSGVEMKSLVEALTREVLLTGKLESTVELSLQLNKLQQFPKNALLSANFHLHNGTLTKVDLLQAANNPTKSDTKGTTNFDDLTGVLNVDSAGYHFKGIKIKSGMLNADGKVDMLPSLELNGALDAEMKGTMGLLSVPLVVSGTLNDPEVKVSRSALAGAAVGTAILGPGLGTALGAKVGGILKKIFGRDEEVAPAKKDTPKQPVTK